MGSTEPREYRQLYPQYRTPKFLEYKQYPHAVQNLEVLRVFAVHIPGIPEYPKYSIYPPIESSLLQLPLVGPFCERFLPNSGYELSTRWTDGRRILHTSSILGVSRVFWCCEYSHYRWTKFCQYLHYPLYRTPRYLRCREYPR